MTDEITAVEGGGIATCETELIESVEQNTLDTDISRWVSVGGGGTPAYYPGGTYGPFDATSNGYIYGTVSPPPVGATLTIDNLKILMVSGATKIRFQGQAVTYGANDYELYDQNDNLVETLSFTSPASDKCYGQPIRLHLFLRLFP